MKIVTKAELKALPKGTPFQQYFGGRAGWPESFDIFVADCGYIDDFLYRSTNSPDSENSTQLFEREDEMLDSGTAYPVDLDVDREGLYDPNARYLVWEPEDVARIINLLQGGDE